MHDAVEKAMAARPGLLGRMRAQEIGDGLTQLNPAAAIGSLAIFNHLFHMEKAERHHRKRHASRHRDRHARGTEHSLRGAARAPHCGAGGQSSAAGAASRPGRGRGNEGSKRSLLETLVDHDRKAPRVPT